MNVKLPLIPKYYLFISFCYNILYIIVQNLIGGQGRETAKKKKEKQDRDGYP